MRPVPRSGAIHGQHHNAHPDETMFTTLCSRISALCEIKGSVEILFFRRILFVETGASGLDPEAIHQIICIG